MLWGSYFVLFFNLITVCIDHITKWFSMLKRWKKRTYLKKTFRILGVGWICAFRWRLFISWLSTGTWEVIWRFCIEIMSCHLLCSKLLLTLPCDVAWGSVFFLPGFWTPLGKQYQGQGIIGVWMKISKRCRERHCGDAWYRSSVIMGTPNTNRFANQKAFFILLLSEWSIFPAAGARKARAKLSKETRLLGLQQTLQSVPMF